MTVIPERYNTSKECKVYMRKRNDFRLFESIGLQCRYLSNWNRGHKQHYSGRYGTAELTSSENI